MRAGIDGFAHGVRDTDIDEEFVGLMKGRRTSSSFRTFRTGTRATTTGG